MIEILILLSIALAHQEYVENEQPVDTTSLQTIQFFEQQDQQMYILFKMPNCEPCVAAEKVWQKLQLDNVYKVDCYEPRSVDICKYFGFKRLPQIVFVQNKHFYWYPAHWEINDQRLTDFVNENTYLDAYIQDKLPENGDIAYLKKATRMFQQILEENARGMDYLNVRLSRFSLILFTLCFIIVPIYLLFTFFQAIWDSRTNQWQNKLVETEKKLNQELEKKTK